MTEQALGTIIFYTDKKHSETLDRINLQGTFQVGGKENEGLLNLWLPPIFYRAAPRQPLRISNHEENLEIALLKKVGGREHLVWSDRPQVNNPEGLGEFDSFSGQIILKVFPWGGGRYVVRAFVGAAVLADGELEVVLDEPRWGDAK